jgi:aspartate-semialdehyde dehydrogenase
VFEENGYTKEEMKLVRENSKNIRIKQSLLRQLRSDVPIVGGHSEAVNITVFK